MKIARLGSVLRSIAHQPPSAAGARKRTLRAGILAASLFFLFVLSGTAGAAVSTDQAGYAPGETVTVNGDNSDGAGYQPGESVNVLVSEPSEETSSCDANVDESGAWSCAITLAEDSSAIGEYSFTATGETSGVSQGGSFTDSGCPNGNSLGSHTNEDPKLSASFTTSAKEATYSFTSANEAPSGGIPGLIEYCVYTSPLPQSNVALYTNLHGAWTPLVPTKTSTAGHFDFGRSGGNPDNLPFDGTTQTIGRAQWSGTVPSSQTILLHINDTAECTALEGKHTETCFVRPGKAAAAAKSPTASKTVAPALTRTYGWGITKAVNTTQIATASSASFNYTVSVTHDAGTDSGWKAFGEISVSNPNSAAITGVKVTDAINDANASCTVTGGASATLPAESTTKFAYSCSYSAQPAASSQTNTATIAWSAQELSNASKLAEGSTTATAAIDWSKATVTVRDGSVTVSDSIAGSLGTVSSTAASPTVFEYSHTVTGDPAGTCTSHENTASFTTSTTATKGSSSKTVKVCVGADLTVSKSAAASFTRAYTWGIAKSADATEVSTASSATVKYSVSVTHDGGTDGGWTVSGTIKVANPNDWESVSLTGVSDAIDNGGSCSITSGNPTGTVPAGSSTELGYTCTYGSPPSASSFTNTATAAWDKTAASTPHGSASGQATGAFGTPTVTDGSVTVSDSIAGSLGTVSSTAASPTVFEYSHTFSGDPAGTCTSHENTASFTTSTTATKGSSSKTVKVCVGADLTVSKTAAASFTRAYTWGITKTAAKPEIDNGVAAATFNYSVSVTHDGGTDGGWTVSGTIKVANPNDWESVSLTGVSDAIDNGGSCSITSGNPTGTVAAGSSAELGYTCTYGSPPSASSFTNTATAAWDKTAASTPHGSASGQATGAFGTPTVTDGSVTVSDSIAGSLGTVSYTNASPKVFAYSHAFTGAKAGTCTSYPNTSTFTTNTSGAKGSASQTVVHCRWGAKYTIKCTGVTWAFSGFPNLPNNTINEKIKVDGVFVYLGTFVFNGSTGGNTVPLSLTPGEHSIAAWAGWKNMNGLTGEADKPAVTVKCK